MEINYLKNDEINSIITFFQDFEVIYRYNFRSYLIPALLPNNALDRAWVRSLALAIACDIHPLNNLRVLRYLTGELKVSEDDKNTWYKHWCVEGLQSIEKILANDTRVGQFCYGDTPSLADCCLIPQLYNAQRFKVDLTNMPTLQRIQANCLALPAFALAAPEQQADAE